MNNIFEKRISSIFNKLILGSYKNPFINNKVLSCCNNIQIKRIPQNMVYNNCSPIGFYNNKMCDIIISNGDNICLTREQCNHLDLVKTKWNFIPHLLLINNNNEIIDIQEYQTVKCPDTTWVSASSTRNYMLDDPLLDFLKYKSNVNKNIIISNSSKKRKRSNSSSSTDSDSFIGHIFKQGNNFEEEIVNIIKNKFPDNFIQIGQSYEARDYDRYIDTIKAINDGIKIIYQPVLWNHSNKTYGCADLIIRSDFTSQIFPCYSNSNFDTIKYEVYDIKWSNIGLRSESDQLLNDGGVRAYKSQILIYTQALNLLQKEQATRGYIIAKSSTREKTSNRITSIQNYGTFEKLGIIDYLQEDEIINKTNDAIKWLKEIKTNKQLQADPPNDPRLYPNMKNTQDNEFSTTKKEMAIKNKEITLVYSVGKRNRDLAIKNDIYTFDDPRLTSYILGFTNSTNKKARLIDSILDINKINQDKKISWTTLSNFGSWKTSRIKCYVDIETINNSVYNLSHNKSNFIFMIGLGVVQNDIWSFYVYTAKDLSWQEEKRILNEFEEQLNKISRDSQYEIPVFHWSHYENINLKPFLNLNNNIKFYDMCKWFMDDEICIRGALDYKLKNIVNSLYKLNLTDIQWSDSITNGANAMNEAFNYYKSANQNKQIMSDIEYYNQIDCKSMWKIHKMFEQLVID